jgi:enolase
MPTLNGLKARQVLDSRGRPTVEVDALASTGSWGRAIVPSGASTGRHEALELRDSDDPRYGGLGVFRAVENVTREIGPAIAGMDLDDQSGIDARLIELDATANKSRLGANALLGVSLAVAHAAAVARGEELFFYLNRLWRQRAAREPNGTFSIAPALPMPMVNMISGGLHAGGNLDIQDVLTIPVGAKSYSESLEMTVALYRAVGAVLGKRGFEASLVGDEGGYGPRLRDNEQAFEIVVEAIRACGFAPGLDVAIAVDVASSHFFDPASGTYRLRTGGEQALDAGGMVDLLTRWVERYPIVSLEDGLAEDDWVGWTLLTKRLGDSVQLIGDDLFVTQIGRLRTGIECRAGNAILIKFNQVGTLSETLDAIRLAKESGFRTVVSARSGETEDATIADLAVATGAGQIKIGSVARSERLAKYNRLLRIEEAIPEPQCFCRFQQFVLRNQG